MQETKVFLDLLLQQVIDVPSPPPEESILDRIRVIIRGQLKGVSQAYLKVEARCIPFTQGVLWQAAEEKRGN